MTINLRVCALVLVAMGLVAGCASSNSGKGAASSATATTGSSTPAATVSSSQSSAGQSSTTVALPADFSAFAGQWTGHDRIVTITAEGIGKESVSDGCCTPEIDLTYQLTAVIDGASSSQASIQVTAVTASSGYTSSIPAPKVGDPGTLTLKGGVITDSLTGATYCDAAEAAKSTCGA